MYAAVAVDILNKHVDRLFTYKVPARLAASLSPGIPVFVPFGSGNRLRRGFIVELAEECGLPDERIKEIDSRDTSSMEVEEQLISLAAWMRHRFGGTMFQCLSVVLPGKSKVKARHERVFIFRGTEEVLRERLALASKKKHYAKKRLLEAFLERKTLPGELVTDRLNISAVTLKPFIEEGLIEIRFREELPAGVTMTGGGSAAPALNAEQQAADTVAESQAEKMPAEEKQETEAEMARKHDYRTDHQHRCSFSLVIEENSEERGEHHCKNGKTAEHFGERLYFSDI